MSSTSSSRSRRKNDVVKEDVGLALRAIDAVPAVHRLRRRERDPGRFAVRAEKAHLQVAVHQPVQGDLVDDPVHVAPPELLEEAAYWSHINEPAKLRQTPIASAETIGVCRNLAGSLIWDQYAASSKSSGGATCTGSSTRSPWTG